MLTFALGLLFAQAYGYANREALEQCNDPVASVRIVRLYRDEWRSRASADPGTVVEELAAASRCFTIDNDTAELDLEVSLAPPPNARLGADPAQPQSGGLAGNLLGALGRATRKRPFEISLRLVTHDQTLVSPKRPEVMRPLRLEDIRQGELGPTSVQYAKDDRTAGALLSIISQLNYLSRDAEQWAAKDSERGRAAAQNVRYTASVLQKYGTAGKPGPVPICLTAVYRSAFAAQATGMTLERVYEDTFKTTDRFGRVHDNARFVGEATVSFRSKPAAKYKLTCRTGDMGLMVGDVVPN